MKTGKEKDRRDLQLQDLCLSMRRSWNDVSGGPSCDRREIIYQYNHHDLSSQLLTAPELPQDWFRVDI